MADAYYVSAADRDVLKEMVAWFRAAVVNTRNRTQPLPDLGPAPDTYVAYVPAAGIPSRDGLTAYAADCQVYRILDGTLEEIDGLTRSVYNLSLQAVTGGQFAVIQRDQFGTWALTGCLYCAYDDADTGTGTGTAAPAGPTAACQFLNFLATPPTATFSNKTGDCTCLPNSPSVTGDGVDAATITTATCPGNVQLNLTCVGGEYNLAGTGLTMTLVSFTASPFVLVYDITGYGANCGGSGGGARITITYP